MKTNIVNSIVKGLNKTKNKIVKYSPEILIGAGTAGVIVSTVLACKETLKVNDILEKGKIEVDLIHDVAEGRIEIEEEYTEKDMKKDLVKVYAHTGFDIVKLYAPSVVLGSLSLGAIIGSNVILKRRNVALAAAYATVDATFKEYRGRVAERFGEDVEKQILHGIKEETIEEKVVNKNGKETVKKTKVETVDPNHYSGFARVFDEGNPYWKKDASYNLMFLNAQQQWANNKLQSTGRLFLNEVYDALGFEQTKAGQVVGWVYDESNVDADNFVDFGIWTATGDPKVTAFINGSERSIILDFNVDGYILDSM